jgi:FkbM family methyltransferase
VRSILRSAGWKISRVVARNGGPISRAAYEAANVYCKAYNNLDYDMKTNGEFALLDRLSKLQVSTIFDVGANKGEYVKACLDRFSQANIHAFEIVPATFRKLSQNVTSPRAILNNVGLSDEVGEVEINYKPDDDGLSSLVAGEQIYGGGWQRVACKDMTGDQYCERHAIDQIDFLKMDVEGAEDKVLRGFERMFGDGRISAVQFEFGMVNIYSKFLLKDFWEFFDRRGFVIGPVMPQRVVFREYNTRDENFQGCPNYVAVRKSNAAMVEAVG